jgi:hypothetical protein
MKRNDHRLQEETTNNSYKHGTYRKWGTNKGTKLVVKTADSRIKFIRYIVIIPIMKIQLLYCNCNHPREVVWKAIIWLMLQ